MSIGNLHPNVMFAIGLVLLVLIAGSVAVPLLKAKYPDRDFNELAQRMKTWWIMVAVFALAMSINRNVSILFFAFLSFLALKEYLTMIPTRRVDHRVMLWLYLAIPVQYIWVATEWYGMFIIFIPVFLFLFLPLRMILIGVTKGFVRSVGTLHWGAMMTIFSLSHVAFLLVLPAERNVNGGGPALVLYLVALTQLNDVAQYVWGKKFGKKKVAPKISPGKTVEGLVGGVCTTVVLAIVFSRLLTPCTLPGAAFAGLIIGLGGFVGDLTISCIKRDLGMKDSGTLLPGHGGILDRVDSLTYTAPLFFHLIYFMHF